MLNIDSKNNFLFIHIPKCAGTSIESFFGFDYDNNINYIEYSFNIGHPKHMTLKEYSKVLPKNIIDNLFKFTIIRNPFDLVVSLYNYGINSEKVIWNGRTDYEYKKNISFNNFVNFLYKLSYENNRNGLNTNVVSLDEYIETENISLDFIGRFENLEKDFKQICNILDINNKTIPFKNKSIKKSNNYKDYYDDKTKDIVSLIFKDELKKYKYDF